MTTGRADSPDDSCLPLEPAPACEEEGWLAPLEAGAFLLDRVERRETALERASPIDPCWSLEFDGEAGFWAKKKPFYRSGDGVVRTRTEATNGGGAPLGRSTPSSADKDCLCISAGTSTTGALACSVFRAERIGDGDKAV